MKLILIGFMGVGKTTVAKLLADRLAWRLIELDDQIVAHTSFKSVYEIFETQGEAFFRNLEHKCCLEAAKQEQAIISAGGGVVQNPKNIQLFKNKNSHIIWLRCSFKIIQERLKQDTPRPLFKNLEKARKLFEEREHLYQSAADYSLDSESYSEQELCEQILTREKLPV